MSDEPTVTLVLYRCAVLTGDGIADAKECRLPVKATPQLGAEEVLLDCPRHGRVRRDFVTLEEHTAKMRDPDPTIGPKLADQMREPYWHRRTGGMDR